MFQRLINRLAIFSVLLLLYFVSYTTLLSHNTKLQNSNHSMAGIWNLPPLAIQFLTGEFKGVVADYLTLEVGARLGTDLRRDPTGGHVVIKKKHNWREIHRIFITSQNLDPSFAQTYILAQGWLPWDAGMLTETNAILQTASDNRPWDWQPMRTMGFNAYYFMNHPGEAGKLFLEAAKRPNAPSFLTIVGSRLALKGGRTEDALFLMKSMLADKVATDPAYGEMTDRYHALLGTVMVEKGVTEYFSRFNSYPENVTELVRAGIIKQAPSNPYDTEYCIDGSGKVYFDNLDCHQK